MSKCNCKETKNIENIDINIEEVKNIEIRDTGKDKDTKRYQNLSLSKSYGGDIFSKERMRESMKKIEEKLNESKKTTYKDYEGNLVETTRGSEYKLKMMSKKNERIKQTNQKTEKLIIMKKYGLFSLSMYPDSGITEFEGDLRYFVKGKIEYKENKIAELDEWYEIIECKCEKAQIGELNRCKCMSCGKVECRKHNVKLYKNIEEKRIAYICNICLEEI